MNRHCVHHKGEFVPKDKRHFFWITAHYDPRPLYSHFYHWFELAQMDIEPHKNEIRRGPLRYNIWDTRNEGMATAVEEIFMQAGLYDDDPRVKEIVYIMLAQRAARGLGSLYAQANEMTMEEAGNIHSEYTPRGWMKTEKELLFLNSIFTCDSRDMAPVILPENISLKMPWRNMPGSKN